MNKRFFLPIAATALLSLLAACQSKQPQQQAGAGAEQPATQQAYQPTRNDGEPWWEVDVDSIPDATPRVHNGQYKASPYKVLGKTYYPLQSANGYREQGMASWYGTKFHGQKTANGEDYDLYGMTAAHKTLPLPSYVRVTNLENGNQVVLRVNDRGPFHDQRIIDLSFAAAKKLGFAEKGIARVEVEGIDAENWQPSLLAATQPQQVEEYQPPQQQHAGAITSGELQEQGTAPAPQGHYLQAGAFANPDAALLLRDKIAGLVAAPVFVNSVATQEQVWHRVRIGPIDSRNQAEQIQQQIRASELATPSFVFNN